jgi:hypothetical protein
MLPRWIGLAPGYAPLRRSQGRPCHRDEGFEGDRSLLHPAALLEFLFPSSLEIKALVGAPTSLIAKQSEKGERTSAGEVDEFPNHPSMQPESDNS